jgi:hypothetical protein
MATLKVSKKSLTKYSTLYRWNGYFGHLSKVIRNHKYWFWTFWTLTLKAANQLVSVMTLTINKKVRLPDHLNKVQI